MRLVGSLCSWIQVSLCKLVVGFSDQYEGSKSVHVPSGVRQESVSKFGLGLLEEPHSSTICQTLPLELCTACIDYRPAMFTPISSPALQALCNLRIG